MTQQTYRIFPGRGTDLGNPRDRILGLGAPELTTAVAHIIATSANGPWPSANKAVAVPFVLDRPATVYQLAWRNGSGTMTDSVDIGIFSSAFARLVSGGGTARSGVSGWQVVDVTDTPLGVGRYYLAISSNGTTANNALFTVTLNASSLDMMGVKDSSDSLYPLPDPLTNMGVPATFTRLPDMAIYTRSSF